jgi:putative ABC transport system permease protein
MIKGAIIRQSKKMLMIALTIMLGVSLGTAMLNVMLDVGDKVNQELKTYGANINVLPKGSFLLDDLYGIDSSLIEDKYLLEEEVVNIKTIFWSFNIIDIAPFLETRINADSQTFKVLGTWFNYQLNLKTGDYITTGLSHIRNWWNIEGEWINDEEDSSVMIGKNVAKALNKKTNDSININGKAQTKNYIIKGIFDSGGNEDNYIYLPLKELQELNNSNGNISRIEVSALTTPDNDLARKAALDINSLSIKEYETWYCTAYVSSISYQIQEVITDSVVKPIRQVADSEGAILEKTQLLMLLITILSLLGSAVGISNLVTASVMERGQEIGLMKALGAKNHQVLLLILSEIFITSLIGGIFGYFIGIGFAQIIGYSVFSSAVSLKVLVIPIISLSVFLITIIGSIPSISSLLRLKPAEVLHGR